MSAGDQVRIKRTTIERGVRLVNSPGGGADESGDYGASKALAIAAIKQKRDTEKAVLNQLNDRFAKYIERVKFLENQNKKLLGDLDELREKWGDESRLIRERYEPELLEARSTIDDTTREKAASEIRAKRAEYEVNNLKRQYDEALTLIQQDKSKMANLEYLVQENQVELELLRRQMSDAETDIVKYRSEVARLGDDLHALLADLDRETLRRVKLENEKQTLEEQIPFLNAIHEQEMAELRLLQSGAHIDPTQFYRHELERAIRDIRSDFDDLNQQQKQELEEWYKIKTEEITQQIAKRDALDSMVKVESPTHLKSTLNDNNREYGDLKQLNNELVHRLSQLEEELDQARRNNLFSIDKQDREIGDIRSRLAELMADYDELMNSKTTLEFEINTYRRLLESEESRNSRVAQQQQNQQRPVSYSYQSSSNTRPLSSGVQQQQQAPVAQQSVASSQPLQQQHQQTVKIPAPNEFRVSTSELSSKTTFQRTAKGPVSISECSPDGKVIILENTSRNKDISLNDWVLKRRVDAQDELVFKFPPNLQLKANKMLRIWARGQGKDQPPGDIVNEEADSWGVGVNVATIVLNDAGEEKATHLQKTVYEILSQI